MTDKLQAPCAPSLLACLLKPLLLLVVVVGLAGPGGSQGDPQPALPGSGHGVYSHC
jgi:hypothetical protein